MNDLRQALTQNNFDLSPADCDQLDQYLNLLSQWNQVFNLTAVRQRKDMISLHVIDSLSVHPHMQGKHIADIGTGAGLPGIPLAILFPQKHFYLIDSNSKKTRFLMQAKSTLGLANVTVIHTRCEKFQAPHPFDVIVSRAFSSIAVMLNVTEHLLAHNGTFVAMKGVYPEEELLEIPSRFVWQVHPLTLQGVDVKRHAVCINRKN